MSGQGDMTLRPAWGGNGSTQPAVAQATAGRRADHRRRSDEVEDDALRVVLIESDPTHLATLRTAVGETGEFVVASEANRPEHGLREVMKARPAVVIVGFDQTEEALDLAAKLAELCPDVTLFVTAGEQSGDLVKRAMRAGAREFLSRPPEPMEVQEALHRLVHQRAQARAPRRTSGEIIAVFGAKGGLGATFVATNLAVLLAGIGGRRAAIVDLDLEVGDVATFLNVKAEHSILDLAGASSGLDAPLVEAALATHPSGLRLLAQPDDAADADRIAAPDVGQVLTRLKTLFEFVVVDTNRRFEERTLEALDLADHILLLVALDLPTIRNARRAVEVFRRLGHVDRLKLVLNRHRATRGSERLERSFGFPVYWRLPDDYSTAISSINAGVPATEVGADTELARAFRGLAERLAGRASAPVRVHAPERNRGGLLRRFLSN